MVTEIQGLFGLMGLKSVNPLEQQAAISSLSTLMSISPGETYSEFQKVRYFICLLSLDRFCFMGAIESCCAERNLFPVPVLERFSRSLFT